VGLLAAVVGDGPDPAVPAVVAEADEEVVELREAPEVAPPKALVGAAPCVRRARAVVLNFDMLGPLLVQDL
jgi:hypothetical protein